MVPQRNHSDPHGVGEKDYWPTGSLHFCDITTMWWHRTWAWINLASTWMQDNPYGLWDQWAMEKNHVDHCRRSVCMVYWTHAWAKKTSSVSRHCHWSTHYFPSTHIAGPSLLPLPLYICTGKLLAPHCCSTPQLTFCSPALTLLAPAPPAPPSPMALRLPTGRREHTDSRETDACSRTLLLASEHCTLMNSTEVYSL